MFTSFITAAMGTPNFQTVAVHRRAASVAEAYKKRIAPKRPSAWVKEKSV
jgi:hypothetical protein